MNTEEKSATLTDIALIDSFKLAWPQVIAYAWEHWDKPDIIDHIVNEPEYYMAQFGFAPKSPFNKNRMIVLIGGRDYELPGKHKDNKDVNKEDKIVPKQLISQLNDLFETIKKGAHFQYCPPKNPPQSGEKTTVEPLPNGWDGFGSLLAGTMIAVIPPKPKDHEIEALNDYIALCTNNPILLT